MPIDISRRTFVKTGAIAAGSTSAIGAYLATQPTQSVATSDFQVNDVVIRNTQGAPQTLTINPSITLDWSELQTAPATVDFAFYVEVTIDGSTSSTTILDESPTVPSESQTTTDSYTFDSFNSDSAISLLNGSLPSASAYEDSTAGDEDTTNRTIRLVVDATLKDASGSTVIARTRSSSNAPLADKTFTVTMEHLKDSSVTADGSANTNGS